ncbi:MAG TPA: endonuclease/exonuclease/phosphatase family protein [Thermoanaerobaculia bacterium]|nr:endonuclease/exonuclease/phosphatase family protein [Thermoanaerobaculia bacterium]
MDEEKIERAARRPLLGILSIFALFILYRVFTVYTVRSGECKPKPVDPNLRLLTRDESGQLVSFPMRLGFPPQPKPLVVMTYNIEGHAELLHANHIAEIADVINSVKPDIVGLQEVHRGTWQSRFHDQAAELMRRTHMNGWFGKSYENFGGAFGNLLLTRGEIVSAFVHPLPSIGEPRTIMESVVRIDGATINVYVTHLTAWGKFNSASRNEQLACVAKHIRTSFYPYLVIGDFNAPPTAAEVERFRKLNAAQICGADIGISHPLLHERIDYVWADYGWDVRAARVVHAGPSDHYPVVTELLWQREK